MVQWLRLCLPSQGVQVQSRVRELRSHTPSGQKYICIYTYIYIYIYIYIYTHTHTHIYNRSNIVTKSIKTFLKSSTSKKKKSACNMGDPGSIPWSGRSPGEWNGNPIQYSCLENIIYQEAWWAMVQDCKESDMAKMT